MIELFSWPTPNGQKVHIALEELGLPYTVRPVDIGTGEQFNPEFLAINPNHRIPAIVDDDGPGGRFALFESGAILIYLAEKAGRLIPNDPAARYVCLQWLMFQMSGVGPMFGQANHFANYAPEKIPYAIDRYRNEAMRLLRVLEKRLAEAKFLAGREYSIADIATYPWVKSAAGTGHIDFDGTPAVKDWLEGVEARPGVERGMAVLADRRRQGPMSDQQREILFGATQHAAR
ncbi:MAG TPA: glutathione S-transferase N-terminal domain-containing protein [Acetobacteraceae bacterium]|nr:glutathione S-transferase N-terminal domain-containing protein [Acetobacteraceae bacterium]